MRIPILLLVLLSSLSSISQPTQLNIDSLKIALVNAKTDSLTILETIKKTERLYVSNVEPLHIILDWCLDKAKKINSKYLQSYAYMAMGFAHYYTDDASEEAVLHFTDALHISEANDYYAISAETYNGIAHFYQLGKQLEKYEEFTLKSIDASRKINLLQGISNGYSSLAAYAFEKDKNNEANIRQAISYQRMANAAGETLKDSSALIIFYLNFSNYLSQAKEFDSAFYYLQRSKVIIDAMRSGNDNMNYYYSKAVIESRMGRFPEAISDYNKSLLYARRYEKRSFESRVHHALYQTYQQTGNPQKALYYLELHRKYKDSALTQQNFARATDIQNKYQREKKEIELLQKNLDLKKEGAKRSTLTILLVSSLVVLSFSGILALVLLKNIRRRKRTYSELEIRNTEIKEQALLLSKQAKLIAKFQSQMNPHFTFNALQNIHDLVVLNENEKATQQIQSLAGLMRQTLINSVKEEITLEEEIKYLQKYIDFEKATCPVSFDFNIRVAEGLDDAVIPPMMLQPLIENAVKHAELEKTINPFVNVLIEKENNLLKLMVQDNGRGLNNEAGNLMNFSHSISILRSRIELLFQQYNGNVSGNKFQILSVPQIDKGTLVQFYLPLNYSF